ncbi:DNA-binding protein SMUBP-2, partial [Stegodyphus mimosarum]
MMSDISSVENFVNKHLALLDLERTTEIEENKCLQECSSVKVLQKKGVCIPKLRFGRSSTGLFGRSLINFEPALSNCSLPSHSISSGDIVGVGNVNSDGRLEIIVSGVVTHVSDSFLTVAFEKNSDSSDLESDVHYTIIKLANDVTYKRLKRALKTLENKGRESHLVNVLFGQASPSVNDSSIFNDILFKNNTLNDTQKEAVKFALSQKEVAILHGPPGTGKTTTVVECILQAVSQKLKVLACAPSNIAVDNLVEKLAPYKVKMVRLGHPARFLTSIQQYSLDAVVSQYDGSDVIDDMHKEVDKLRGKIEKIKGSAGRKALWAENKSLLKEIKEREKSIVKQVLKNVDIVLSTLTSASDDGPLKHIDKDHFDICFIDECSQALEASCWIPLMMVKRCVLAGDHHQLPPTIISEKAAKEGLSLTLMERLLKLHGDVIKKMLTVQYRMNHIIMQWSSSELYDSKLQAHESVHSHLLSHLPGIESNDDTTVPLLLIDTAGCDLYELEAENEESKGNEGEANLVALHVENLIKSGLSPTDIAVITPYNLQVDLIKARFSAKYPKLEIKSVDGFQGREKEAVVLSLVRSNDEGEVGFLSEDRRINVAITRAKRHLAVICNSDTVSHHKFLKSFINYCIENGEVRTAFQHIDEIGQYSIATKRPSKKSEKLISSYKSNKTPINSNIKKSADSVTIPVLSKGSGQLHKENIDRMAVESKFRDIIQDFIKSDKQTFSFSPSLSAFERRTVHEISEQYGLRHVSHGEGDDRHIEIKKQPDVASTMNAYTSEKTEIQSESTVNTFECITTNNENNQGHSSKSYENKLPSKNKEGTLKNKEKKEVKKVSQSSKSKLKSLKLQENKNSEDNFDELIEQVMKADKTCCFEKCKKCIATLSQVCQFCRGRFCFSHFFPEVHGCGDAAKAFARSQIRKDGVIYPGSGKPQKKVDPIKRSHLQNKLDKKLNELSSQRKPKPKPKD